MEKRVIGLYCFVIFLFSVLLFRLYYLSASDYLTAVADNQSSYTLEIASTRGQIYDRDFQPMTDNDYDYIAAVMPCPESLNAIAQGITGMERSDALERMKQGSPFLMKISRDNLYARGLDIFQVSQRYAEKQLAPHIVGYLDGWSGKGVRGIELAYDEYLAAVGEEVSVTYAVDALKRPMTGVLPEISGDSIPPKEGIVLTLDKGIQAVAQEAAQDIPEGAVVVMDVQTGDLLASVSMPEFSPNHVEEALEGEGAPLFNRVFGAYSVGSTFKLAVASAALKQGISPDFTCFCPGYVEVNGITFSCHNKAGHGWVDMKTAIEQSCNPYFVKLGQEIEPQNLLAVVEQMGFGKSCQLAPGMTAEAGSVYTAVELENKANLANFSFGQGVLTATPIQIAQMVSCIANGGYGVTPRLVKGNTTDGETLAQGGEEFARNQILTAGQAKTMRDFMINVVEEGSGKKGKPEHGGAGGKTASAQTGFYTNGEEKIEAWFAGFYPAKSPRYAIVVFIEGGKYGGDVASPIFKKIADGIYNLEKDA